MGSRKDPDRIIPLGLSARDRVLPIWEPLYSSKAASWVGMLLERVILGVVAAVGLTGRTEGRGQEKDGAGEEAGSPALRALGGWSSRREGAGEEGGRAGASRWGQEGSPGPRAQMEEGPAVWNEG